MRLFRIYTLFLLSFGVVHAWDDAEMDIFDLVEEVNSINQNFYEYMELTQEATTSEIRKAYRKLSLVLHPDKSDAEDAELKFRWLASIYEILKDTEKRAIYDRVLVEGLPDWRHPAFYFRRMRKIGLAECLAYLFVIITVFQYCIYWAHYWEKKFTLKEAVSTQMAKRSAKKKQKAAGKTDDEIMKSIEEQEAEVLGPPPTIYDTLPFQCWHLGKYLSVTVPLLPWTLKDMYIEMKEKREEEERIQKEEEEELKRREEEKREKKERKKERKRNFVYDEKVGESSGVSENEAVKTKKESVFILPRNANQIWTDIDLAKLARLIKKYPAGTPERWERIAEMMERLPAEVTKMAKKIKDNPFVVPASQHNQGITGLEDKKIVSDDVMEDAYNEDQEEDSEEEEDEDAETESDEDGYGAYTVASKEDFVHVETKSKVKTKGGKYGTNEVADNAETIKSNEDKPTETPAPPPEDVWSQAQQKALESSLTQFPKGTTERWERIANKVPGKTKEQCIQRFKTLAEMVKKKKLEGESTS